MLAVAFIQGAVQACQVLPEHDRIDLSLVVRASPESPLHDRPPQIVDVRIPRAVHTLTPIPPGTILRVRGLPVSDTREISLHHFLPRLPGDCQVVLPEGVRPSDITRNITWGHIRATTVVSVKPGDDVNEGAVDGLVVSGRPFRSADGSSCVRLATYPFRPVDVDSRGREKAVYITLAMPSGQTYAQKSRVTAWGAWVSYTTRTTLADLMNNHKARGLSITDGDGRPFDMRKIEVTSRNLVLYPLESYRSEDCAAVLKHHEEARQAAVVPYDEALDERLAEEPLGLPEAGG